MKDELNMLVVESDTPAALAQYIFLSRIAHLPLSALKVISDKIGFSQTIEYSEAQFKSLVDNLAKNPRIRILDVDKVVSAFGSSRNAATLGNIERMLENCSVNGIRCLSYFSNNFPAALKQLSSPPKFIFLKGEIRKSDCRAVAMIGTREPTQYGREMAIKIARRFVDLGFTIVSGLARGIDGISMKAALDHGGRAIGVLGCGLLNIYPPENTGLAEAVVKSGALVSEMFPEERVNPRALQMRNRITSGFGLANVVVEGRKDSGTKWQIRFGREQGKPPVAVMPIDESAEQAVVPMMIIQSREGYVIKDISDVDGIAEMITKPKPSFKQTTLTMN